MSDVPSLISVSVPIVRVAAASVADLRTLAEKRAPDPAIFDEHEPFFWRAIPSTGALDSYFTMMADSTLKNFAKESKEGRAFQNSHNHMELPIGYSLTGEYINGATALESRVEADYYTMRGLMMADISTDVFIAMVRGGIVRDVSVGFSGGEWICSICGQDMMVGWECWHFPGFVYDKGDDSDRKKKSSETKGALCTATIENGHLSETSAVFDGATPGAAVAKAYREIELGRMKPDQAALMEQRFRIKLPPIATQFAPGGLPGDAAPSRKENKDMDFEASVRAALGIAEDDDAIKSITGLQRGVATADTSRTRAEGQLAGITTVIGEVGCPEGTDPAIWLRAEFGKLRPQAEDGQKYRSSLITDALAEGKRAHGESFADEIYKGMLNSSATSIDAITRMRDDWKVAGDKIFGNGRQTEEVEDPANPIEKKDRVNASHYRTR